MKYARLERERRFLLAALPGDLRAGVYVEIDDLYLTGTRLRLRKISPPDGTSTVYKLNQKIEEDAARRIVTSVYLSEQEYTRLSSLDGRRLTKRRYPYVQDGVRFAVDVFGGALQGLLLSEVEFFSEPAFAAFTTPAFVHCEVTGRGEFSGAQLAWTPPGVSLDAARRLLAGPSGASHRPTHSAALLIRPLTPADPAVISRAFSAMGWTKPEAQYVRYLDEQNAGSRVVLVAFLAGEFAGYVTVVWRPEYQPFVSAGIPEIQDLNVLAHVRRRRVASRLLDEAEACIGTRSPIAGIGVGLHPGYNAAQRLYVLRGYVPDGRGVAHGGRFVQAGDLAPFDDDLVLRFTKELSFASTTIENRVPP